ncbi:MAG: hypothetical protein ACI4EQ_03090 [Lachnospiraceae bacterium]
MGLFPVLNTKTRNTVSEPEGMKIFKGLAWMAAGLVGLSFIATSVTVMWKMIFSVLGIIFLGIGGKWIRKYVLEYKAFRQFVPTWDSERGMYDRFAQEFNAWQQDDIVPICCDGDTLYFLKLQKERLRKKGLKMTNRVMPVKGRSFGTATLSRKTPWYMTDMVYEEINRMIRFENAQGPVYEREVEQVMYDIIIHTPNDEQISHITMTCPNCVAVSQVATLEEGCKYCGTRFRITDLFPRVVNHFFLRNTSTATASGVVGRTIFFTIFVVLVVLLSAVIMGKDGFLPASLATCFFGAAFCGGLGGLILASLRLLFTLFNRDGMRHVSLFWWANSKKKITDIMKKYDPNFAFDKFEGQIVALIRMAVFTEQPETLACYRGGQRDARFSDILEMTYTNAICLKHVRMEGNILHMSLRTWWVNYSENQGKVRKTGDCIDVTLSRNVAVMEPPGFSITSVACPNCGGSFDAVRQKVCPYCGGEYHMENVGWVIDNMRLIS